jgi:hypothetical protein
MAIRHYLKGVEVANAERDEANARATAAVLLAAEALRACAIATSERQAIAYYLTRLVEPGRDPNCKKIRVYNKEQAQALADKIGAETGEAMEPYPCKWCSRHPITLERYWHIQNADPKQRGSRPKRNRGSRGRPTLLSHLSPDIVRELRDRTR